MVQKHQDNTKDLEEEMRAKMAADKKDASVTPTHNQNKENSSTDTEYSIADID